MPPDLAHRLGAAGVFRMFVPSKLGGDPVNPLTAYVIVAELRRARRLDRLDVDDPEHHVLQLVARTRGRAAILETEPLSGMAGMFAPIGRTEPAGDGMVRLTGRYPFNSGSPHASWFCEGAFVTRASGAPDWRFLFLPKSDVEILDTWRVAGLRGTASHDVARRRRARAARAHSEPGLRSGAARRTALSVVVLRAARLADGRRAHRRRSSRARRVLRARRTQEPRRGGFARDRTSDAARRRAVRRIATRRGGVRGGLDRRCLGHGARRGRHLPRPAPRDPAGPCERHAGVASTSSTPRSPSPAVARLFDDNPLQRCWRDLHAASSHIFFSTSLGHLAERCCSTSPSRSS